MNHHQLSAKFSVPTQANAGPSQGKLSEADDAFYKQGYQNPLEMFYLEYQRFMEPENRHFSTGTLLVHSCTSLGVNIQRQIPMIKISVITGVIYEEMKRHLFPKVKLGDLKVSLCKYNSDGTIRTKWMLRQPLPVAMESHLRLVDTQTGEPLMPATQHIIWIRHDGMYPVANECQKT